MRSKGDNSDGLDDHFRGQNVKLTEEYWKEIALLDPPIHLQFLLSLSTSTSMNIFHQIAAEARYLHTMPVKVSS